MRVPLGPPHNALLVSDRALDTIGTENLYVLNDKNEIVSRPVRTGSPQGGLRVIEEGLTNPGERVVINGLQLVRPGVTVNQPPGTMPNSGFKDHVSGATPSTADRNRRRHRRSHWRPGEAAEPLTGANMLARFFIDRPVWRGYLDCDHPHGRPRGGAAPGGPVSGGHSANGPRITASYPGANAQVIADTVAAPMSSRSTALRRCCT